MSACGCTQGATCCTRKDKGRRGTTTVAQKGSGSSRSFSSSFSSFSLKGANKSAHTTGKRSSTEQWTSGALVEVGRKAPRRHLCSVAGKGVKRRTRERRALHQPLPPLPILSNPSLTLFLFSPRRNTSPPTSSPSNNTKSSPPPSVSSSPVRKRARQILDGEGRARLRSSRWRGRSRGRWRCVASFRRSSFSSSCCFAR